MTVVLFTPPRFEDPRGWFTETWNREKLKSLGIFGDFCQDNQSYSAAAGTLRGLHFQHNPHAQAKLVRCVRGRIFDVAVDIRSKSPTYKRWVGIELTAAEGNQLYIPAGYAHGFLTLEDDCEIAYKVDAFYSPQSDSGILWNDGELAIDWPLGPLTPLLSEKDANLKALHESNVEFGYNGNPLLPLF